MRAPFATGVVSALVSTLASRWLIQHVERDRSLAPYAAYRIALAALVIARLTDRPTTMAQ
jgi:undecaprenyl pyrophosphate phosphatase UppP